MRARFYLYLLTVHLVFLVGAWLLLSEHRAWLLAVEGFFVVSLVLGLVLLHRLSEPVRMIRTATELVADHDFGTRFREVGHPELDPLIRVYNRMADSLREERIRTEEQESFLQRIVAASPSGIVVLDLDRRVEMVNAAAAALLGSPPEELHGRRLSQLGTPFANRLAAMGTDEVELVHLQGPRRIRCHALTFMDRGFERQFIITDELTDELYRTEKAAYGTLIRVISHEVNNTAGSVTSLLDSCRGWADQLEPAVRDDYIEALQVAITRTRRLRRFIEEYAEVVRLPMPRRESCDLAALVAEVLRLLRHEADSRRVTIRVDADPDLPELEVDPAQMEQVLINLLKNALEAVGADGTVSVRLHSDSGRPVAEIRDTGPGVPDEIEPHLFEPFYSSKPDGQGIGLTVVREVLQRHGCDFSLRNRKGGGAVFTIAF